MRTSFDTWRIVVQLVVAVVATTTPSMQQPRAENGSYGAGLGLSKEMRTQQKRLSTFLSQYGGYVFSVTNTPLSDLREVVSDSFSGDVAVNKILTNHNYQFAVDSFSPLDSAFYGISDWCPLPVQAQYLRRSLAVKAVADADAAFLWDYLISRKDRLPPTVWDAVLLWESSRWWMEHFVIPTAKSPEGKAKWRQLLHAKNPIYRMMAVNASKIWADQSEAANVWKGALSDEYWYTRFLAVDYLGGARPPGTKEILEEFLRRKIDPNMPPAFLAKERELNERANRILASLRQSTAAPAPRQR
jgi:hypothetical protein